MINMDLHTIQKRAWQTAEENGFHEARSNSTAVALALIHSEVSEALEYDRADLPDDLAEELRERAILADDPELKSTLNEAADELEPDDLGEELADIVIRCADLAETEGIDLQYAVEEKMIENEQREYKHGKEY